MRLLLTGATGFLGRHVAAAAQDQTLIRATRAAAPAGPGELALGSAPWQRRALARALQETRPDVVLHCAGATGSRDARACFEANTVLAAELLAAADSVPHKPRVILIGSAAEYGVVAPQDNPAAETLICNPVTEYGVAKYAQTLLGLAARGRGLDVLTVRLFNAVGVGMPPHLALPSFARQLTEPSPSLRVGDLSARRDFLDVADAARILLRLAALPEWNWPLVNLCSGQSFRIGDLLDRMIVESGYEGRIETDPSLLRPLDMPELRGSTGRLAEVGLRPPAPDFDVLLPHLLQGR